MKLNYPLRVIVTLLAICVAAWFWYSDGVDRGLDLKGGASLVYKLDDRDIAEILSKNPAAEPLLDTVSVIEERINNLGLKDVKVDALGGDQFEVQFPGKEPSEVARIKSILTQLGQLEFRIVARGEKEEEERAKREREGANYKEPPGFRWYPPRPKRDAQGNETPSGEPDRLVELPEFSAQQEVDYYFGEIQRLESRQRRLEDLLADPATPDREELQSELDGIPGVLGERRSQLEAKNRPLEDALKKDYFTGQDLSPSALQVRPDPQGFGFVVAFATNDTRKQDFTNFTQRNIKRQMAIIIDGLVESSPVIRDVLPGSGIISGGQAGGFKQEEAHGLVTVLRSGSLSVGITLSREWSIGPSLGEAAIKRGVIATAIGMAVVVIFMLATYLFPGMVAIFALFLNLLLIMGALAFAQAQLSLPGIAGVILTVGMAVDANILVFERIREERKRGQSLLQAVKAGYDRAFVTIIDANVTTLFAAVVLVFFVTGQVRGFAITLIVGILASMFTTLFVTKTVFMWLIEKGFVKKMRMPEIFGVPRISYTRIRLPVTLVSLAVIAAGVFAYQAVGDDKYDIEFVGGQRVVAAFQEPVPIKEVKDKIAARYENATVISIKSEAAEAGALDQSVANDRYQITIEAAKEAAEQEEAIAYLMEAFEGQLMPEPVIIGSAPIGIAEGRRKVTFNFQRVVTEDELGQILDRTPGLVDVKITEVAGKTAILELEFERAGELGRRVEEQFLERVAGSLRELHEEDRLTDLKFSEAFPMKNFVDPQTAQNHRNDAIKAVLISLIFQIIYIYFRFHGASYGFAAVIALVHDVLITLGAIAFFGWMGLVNVKINLPIIAAILTLIGYSMNDTIVVFDRIRENLKKGRQNLTKVLDLSVNQTMERSLKTSITTFLVVMVLFIVNYGAASSLLEGFAFVLMIGVVTGTYSSIFIASPMLSFLPWHYLRGRGGRFWGLVLISLIGAMVFLFTSGGTALQAATIVAMCAYPAYFLIDLLRWLTLSDPDRALNIALRSGANR